MPAKFQGSKLELENFSSTASTFTLFSSMGIPYYIRFRYFATSKTVTIAPSICSFPNRLLQACSSENQFNCLSYGYLNQHAMGELWSKRLKKGFQVVLHIHQYIYTLFITGHYLLYLICILFLQMNFDHNAAPLQQLFDCSDAFSSNEVILIL